VHEHRGGVPHDVLRGDEVAIVHVGRCTGDLRQRQRTARAHPELQFLMLTRGRGERDDVIDERLRQTDAIDGVLHRQHARGIHDRLDRGQRGASGLLQDHAALVVGAWIPERDAHQEAIELVLRQRVGALEFVGILRRHHHEGLRQPVRDPLDGDGPLAHGLEQRTLGAGRGAVDLVGQHDVGEDRPRPELELSSVAQEDAGTRDVAGQEVRRALDTAEGALQAAGERARERGLAHAGNILDQRVPAREQAGDQAIDGLAIAQVRRADRVAQLLHGSHESMSIGALGFDHVRPHRDPPALSIVPS
jgi:hypothetical protein